MYLPLVKGHVRRDATSDNFFGLCVIDVMKAPLIHFETVISHEN